MAARVGVGVFPAGWFFGVDVGLPEILNEFTFGGPPFTGTLSASGGSVFSADADEEKDLANEPRDGMRAVVRRVLSTSGEYERSKRELLINRQVARTGTPRDRQRAAMARIEALARDGASIEEIAGRLRAEGLTPSSGFLFSRARLRRIIAVTEADRTKLTSGAIKSQSPWSRGT